MAKTQSTFPTTIDSTLQTDRVSGDMITSDSYDILEDAVFELETKVGVNNSSVPESLDYKVTDLQNQINSHNTNHQDGGTDEINVTGLSGELVDLQKVKDHTHQSSGNGVGGKLDHGLALDGLLDDDHTQYRLESEDHNHQSTGLEGGKLDHGLALDGLGDDDHTQYLLADGSRNADKLIITNGANHYLQVPQLTTAERDALTPVEGMIIYNSTTDQFERYQQSAWAAFGGGGGVTDHGDLTGLGDDDHTQYALLAGRSSGQTLYGGIASGENLNLRSTSDATKGKIYLGTASVYDEVNDRLGIGTTSPNAELTIVSPTAAAIGQIIKGAASQTGNLQEWRNSADAILSFVNKDGRLTLGSPYSSVQNSWPLAIGGGMYFGKENFYLNIRIESEKTNTVQFRNFGTMTVSVNSFQGVRGRGTLASKLPAQDGDTLFEVLGKSWGTDQEDHLAAAVRFIARGQSVTGHSPGKVSFLTTPDGSDTLVERMYVDKDGSVVFPIDNQPIVFGGGQDAKLYYDGTDLILDPDVVGTGKVKVDGSLQATDYYSGDGSPGLSGTYTFGGGSSGDIASMTFKDGLLTAVTTVP